MEFTFKSLEEISGLEMYQILQLRQEVFIIEQNCIYEDCDNKDLQAIHLIGKINNQVEAYCRILDKGISYPNYASIGRVVARKNQRTFGYGRKLMEEAIAFCKNKYNNKPIKISAQVYLINFYASLGFETEGETYLEDDIPHIAMILHFQ